MKLNTQMILELARKHLGNGAAMDSSARLCFADAQAQYDAGDLKAARICAMRSLKYSVGILHADFDKAALAHSRMTP